MYKPPIRQPMKGVLITDPATLVYPGLISTKLDGIRAIVFNGSVYSASMKLIPNQHVQRLFGGLPDGTDGELGVGPPTDPGFFKASHSAVMRISGEPEVTFYAFDMYHPKAGFLDRLLNLTDLRSYPNVVVVHQELVSSVDQFMVYYHGYLNQGYEGVVYRSVSGPYKAGKSTALEGWMLKLKPFRDSEAIILAVNPLQINQNDTYQDETGHTKRSSAKAGRHDIESVGSFTVRDIHGLFGGVEFNVGSGIDRKPNPTRDSGPELWMIRDELIGRTIRYKYFDIGSYDAPRMPTYEGFRDSIDITE